MNVLVAGGAGYIGSIMTKRLLDDGYRVVVVDSLERGEKEAVDKRADFKKGNLLDKQFVSTLFSREKFDTVIHFAGYISMEESMKKPGIYFENNVLGIINVLEQMKKQDRKNFIFSSTAGIYGDPIQTPIPEDHPKNPTNPYGESKLMVERILSWYQEIHDINFISLRYFNAAGAAVDASRGEHHIPETHIIPNAIFAALHNEEFTLYGDNYETPDGTCIRDYIHVVDLVKAHVLVLKKLQVDKGGFYYNVGTGNGYSNKEVISMVEKVSQTSIKLKIEKRRHGDASVLIADPTRIKHELGFAPEYSDLETIVKTAWEWHKKNSK